MAPISEEDQAALGSLMPEFIHCFLAPILNWRGDV